MNKDTALDLALEALEYFTDTSVSAMDHAMAEDAITAIKQARSAPVQEPAIKQGWDVDTLLDKPVAQRQWVSLTDEERYELLDKAYNPESYAVLIEAKLKEKNNG
jgi:hypothetical protein